MHATLAVLVDKGKKEKGKKKKINNNNNNNSNNNHSQNPIGIGRPMAQRLEGAFQEGKKNLTAEPCASSVVHI